MYFYYEASNKLFKLLISSFKFSFLVSTIVALIVIPILRKLKVGQIERVEGPQSHLKKQGTPTMGGVIMIISIILYRVNQT